MRSLLLRSTKETCRMKSMEKQKTIVFLYDQELCFVVIFDWCVSPSFLSAVGASNTTHSLSHCPVEASRVVVQTRKEACRRLLTPALPWMIRSDGVVWSCVILDVTLCRRHEQEPQDPYFPAGPPPPEPMSFNTPHIDIFTLEVVC
jgi:hypothetical protein